MNYIKKILVLITVLTINAYAYAKQPEINVVIDNTAGSNGPLFYNWFVPLLEKNFDKVNIIQASDCNKATDLYEKINDKPVVLLNQAQYYWLKEINKHTCGVKTTSENIWIDFTFQQGVCTAGPDSSVENFKKATKFGSPVPHEFTTLLIKQLNSSGMKLQEIPYNGGGGLTMPALLSGEIDYTTLALIRAKDLIVEKKISCFAKMGESTANYKGLTTFIPNVPLGDATLLYVGIGKNFTDENFQQFRTFVQELYHDQSIKKQFDESYIEFVSGNTNDLIRYHDEQKKLYMTAFVQ
jgi:hypothetical protein